MFDSKFRFGSGPFDGNRISVIEAAKGETCPRDKEQEQGGCDDLRHWSLHVGAARQTRVARCPKAVIGDRQLLTDLRLGAARPTLGAHQPTADSSAQHSRRRSAPAARPSPTRLRHWQGRLWKRKPNIHATRANSAAAVPADSHPFRGRKRKTLEYFPCERHTTHTRDWRSGLVQAPIRARQAQT